MPEAFWPRVYTYCTDKTHPATHSHRRNVALLVARLSFRLPWAATVLRECAGIRRENPCETIKGHTTLDTTLLVQYVRPSQVESKTITFSTKDRKLTGRTDRTGSVGVPQPKCHHVTCLCARGLLRAVLGRLRIVVAYR